MPTFVDADVFRSASLENMVSHLSGPLSAGAVDTEVEVGPTAEVVITRVLRDPLLLAAPRTGLGARGLRLGVRLGSGQSVRVSHCPVPSTYCVTRGIAPMFVCIPFKYWSNQRSAIESRFGTPPAGRPAPLDPSTCVHGPTSNRVVTCYFNRS